MQGPSDVNHYHDHTYSKRNGGNNVYWILAWSERYRKIRGLRQALHCELYNLEYRISEEFDVKGYSLRIESTNFLVMTRASAFIKRVAEIDFFVDYELHPTLLVV